jgi:3-dehydroquinate synthase
MRRLRVKSKRANYDVVVGRGAWRALRRFPQARYSSTFVLTERSLWNRWGRIFLRESGVAGPTALFVPPGEASKSLRRVEQVAGALLDQGADRRTLLIVFGGGVVGDLGGFVASTYMRGIDYVQVPTTVVAQVDSAVGGKTGVNVGAMKNLIGTFYPPRLVLADPVVLASLDERAFRSGLYEVAKHAILAGSPFFDWFEASLPSLRPDNLKTLGPILERAVRVKVDVVSRDEREARLRQILNLGHTFGHALEEATHYRRFLHGEAVGWGLLAATQLARRLGVLDAGKKGTANGGRLQGERMIRLVRRVGPLPPIRDLEPEKILELLRRDKKAVGGRIHWVLPERIGRVRIVADVPAAAAEAAFRDAQALE